MHQVDAVVEEHVRSHGTDETDGLVPPKAQPYYVCEWSLKKVSVDLSSVLREVCEIRLRAIAGALGG
jgi:hypothetical protein